MQKQTVSLQLPQRWATDTSFEEMLKGGYNIGGEQSGHIILLDYANTGDGELTGTKLLTVLKCTGEKGKRACFLHGVLSAGTCER